MADRVRWTKSATVDLGDVVADRKLIIQLVANAEQTLHIVTQSDDDEGVGIDGVMWHRGFTHDQQRQIARGLLAAGHSPQVWDFFLIYRPIRQQRFQVRGVVSAEMVGAQILSVFSPLIGLQIPLTPYPRQSDIHGQA